MLRMFPVSRPCLLSHYTSPTLANTNGIRDSESQYPHWFRKWGVSDRRLTKELVEEIAMALSRHSKRGMSTSRVAIKRESQEEPLDTRKAKRHLKSRDSAIPPEGMQPGW
jgi:hypothetical protein